MVETLRFHRRGHGFEPWSGTDVQRGAAKKPENCAVCIEMKWGLGAYTRHLHDYGYFKAHTHLPSGSQLTPRHCSNSVLSSLSSCRLFFISPAWVGGFWWLPAAYVWALSSLTWPGVSPAPLPSNPILAGCSRHALHLCGLPVSLLSTTPLLAWAPPSFKALFCTPWLWGPPIPLTSWAGQGCCPLFRAGQEHGLGQ